MDSNITYYIRARHRGLKTREGQYSTPSNFHTKGIEPVNQIQKIVPPDSAGDRYGGFGFSMSKNGDVVVLSARSETYNGLTSLGRVAIYKRDVNGLFTFLQKLEPLVQFAFRYFGNSISISDDGLLIAINSASVSNNYNLVDLFRLTNGLYAYEQSITISTSITNGANFPPQTLILSDTLILTSSPSQEDVNFFEFNGTSWVKTKINRPGSVSSYFGLCLSVNEAKTKLTISGPINTGYGSLGVAIYEKQGATWNHVQTLSPPSNNDFGRTASLSGDGLYLVVGARLDDTAGVNNGAAYVYYHNGTEFVLLETLLLLNQSGTGNEFGYSSCINRDGSVFAIGERYGDTYMGTMDGVVHVYSRSGSTITKIASLEGIGNWGKYFGSRMDMDYVGGRLVISADNDGDTASGKGAFYLYE